MFKFVRSLDGSYLQPQAVTATAGTYHVGEALQLSAGNVSLASGNSRVRFVCMEDKTLTAAGELLAAPVTTGMIFEAPITAFSASTQKPGLSVTVHTDGLKVTATAATAMYASSGTSFSSVAMPTFVGAQVVDVCDAVAAGDKIHISFN